MYIDCKKILKLKHLHQILLAMLERCTYINFDKYSLNFICVLNMHAFTNVKMIVCLYPQMVNEYLMPW